MDSLTALSTAAAVVQFVDFGRRLFSETWQTYNRASGQSVALEDLSTVSQDLSQLVAAIKKPLEALRKHEWDDAADLQLYENCHECEAIALELQRLLTKINGTFQKEVKSSQNSLQNGQDGTHKPASVGHCFRVALKAMWQRDNLETLEARLEGVRQRITSTATLSVWLKSNETKNWEKEFSVKLDAMIQAFNEAMTPIGPAERHGHEEESESFETAAPGSLLGNGVAENIVSRLWSENWRPDSALLSSFPQETAISTSHVAAVITESLKFTTIDRREEAIFGTFDATYDWVFEDAPRTSDTGEPMWSSFPQWLETDSRVPYWITGKPGSGKSTMVKHIVNHPRLVSLLEPWANGLPLCKIKYYAWKPGLDLEKSEEGLLRTLLHQVLTLHPDLTAALCPRRWALFHTVRTTNFPKWTTSELRESFAELLRRIESTMRLIIFIDGLDEFNVAPGELCLMIQEIASHGSSLKICVASRLWPQFSDAFSNSPRMQMHLLTYNDIQSFVIGSFRDVAAFAEFNDLYRDDGDKLLADIVAKSDGVFLWTALVSKALLEAITEGSSLFQLRELLEQMPAEIEDLYDTIYAAIPAKLLPDVSVIILTFECACQPPSCLTVWLADELRCRQTEMDPQMLNDTKIHVSMKRRLGARTRGILELDEASGGIKYLHRTAAEWIRKPRVWQQLQSRSPPGFDPYLALLQAETVRLSPPPPSGHFLLGDSSFWRRVTQALLYASLVDSAMIPDALLNSFVDRLRRTASKHFVAYDTWPSYQVYSRDNHRGPENTFDGLAVQFVITPYVLARLAEDPSRFNRPTDVESLCIIEQAIDGFAPFTDGHADIGADPSKITDSRRFDLLRQLLLKGVRPLDAEDLLRSSRASATSQTPLYKRSAQYYQNVLGILAEFGITEENEAKRRKKRSRIMSKFKGFF